MPFKMRHVAKSSGSGGVSTEAKRAERGAATAGAKLRGVVRWSSAPSRGGTSRPAPRAPNAGYLQLGFAAIASATAPEATDDAAVTARVADRLTAERELFG